MTRWLRFVTSLTPSKALKGLMLLIAVKLAVMAVLFLSPPVDAPQGPVAELSPIELVLPTVRGLIGEGVAHAQDSPNATATPGADDFQTTTQPSDDALNAGERMTERELLLKKQDEINRREQSLKVLEQDLDAKLARLTELESKLQRMLEQAEEVKDKKLKHLIDVYSNMKAKQAAQVIETLDEKIAVKILAGMRGRQAGEILTYVKAEKAARLTEALTAMQIPY